MSFPDSSNKAPNIFFNVTDDTASPSPVSVVPVASTTVIVDTPPPVVNLPPVAVDDNVTTSENTPLSIDVLANDSDPNSDPLTVIEIDGNPATVGVPIAVSNGTATLEVAGTILFTPTTGYDGTTSFTYTISDGTLTATASVFVEVINVNLPPVANDVIATTDEDVALNGNVMTDGIPDSDPDGDPISVTQFVINSTTYLPGNTVIMSGIGSLTINSNGDYTFTPIPNYNGSVPVATYTISDGSLTDTATLTITVDPVADAPIANDDSFNVDQDDVLSNDVSTNDTASVDGGNTWTILSAASNGVVSMNTDGTFTYTPTPGYSGPDSFTYMLNSNGGSDIATVSITVDAVAALVYRQTLVDGDTISQIHFEETDGNVINSVSGAPNPDFSSAPWAVASTYGLVDNGLLVPGSDSDGVNLANNNITAPTAQSHETAFFNPGGQSSGDILMVNTELFFFNSFEGFAALEFRLIDGDTPTPTILIQTAFTAELVYQFSFPVNDWTFVCHEFDVDTNTFSLYVDGSRVVNTTLDAIWTDYDGVNYDDVGNWFRIVQGAGVYFDEYRQSDIVRDSGPTYDLQVPAP